MLERLVPRWSHGRIDDLLLIPNAKQPPFRVPKDITSLSFDTRDGRVRAYQAGKGPTVVFVHGWGGRASQFFPLMRGLAQIGFSAIAFDHLGHGQSETKRANLHQFIATTTFMLHHASHRTPEGLYAVVGHSTGCIAIANARPALIREIPLFLISPIFNYRLFYLKRLVKLKVRKRQLKQYTSRFAREYQREFGKLELGRMLARYGDMSVIVHDRSDNESPVADSMKFCQRYPLTKLRLTRGLDHLKIINSESTWQELKSHLNYEDTTINFADKYLTEIV